MYADTDDQAYVYHGDARATAPNPSRTPAAPADARAVGTAAVKHAGAASRSDVVMARTDPVEFVNLFRAQIEKSMALIEQVCEALSY